MGTTGSERVRPKDVSKPQQKQNGSGFFGWFVVLLLLAGGYVWYDGEQQKARQQEEADRLAGPPTVTMYSTVTGDAYEVLPTQVWDRFRAGRLGFLRDQVCDLSNGSTTISLTGDQLSRFSETTDAIFYKFVGVKHASRPTNMAPPDAQLPDPTPAPPPRQAQNYETFEDVLERAQTQTGTWQGGAAYRGALPSLDQSKPVHVDGYTRKDGTYVRPHTRNAPHHR